MNHPVKHDHESGFTMLELMIVMAVLAALFITGFSVIRSLQSQARIDLTLEELKELSSLAEQVRLLPGGDNFTRIGTAQAALFVQTAGGNTGASSTTVNRNNPDGRPYFITTLNMRAGVVETDLTGLNLSPYGITATNIGANSRLKANYRLSHKSPFSNQSSWNKKIWYCEGYIPANKPAHCP